MDWATTLAVYFASFELPMQAAYPGVVLTRARQADQFQTVMMLEVVQQVFPEPTSPQILVTALTRV